ncbi:MAG TPA: hypothetical protein VFL80_11195, partial [Thermoanaerobaculia bacterium]|nr:hypothetical protein [Thermoanaerobaculia bacterium]
MNPLRKLTLTAIAAILFAVPGAFAKERPQAVDLTAQFAQGGLSVERLRVVEVGGIVVIRGRTANRAAAEEAGQLAQRLGYTRVANLVQ